MATIGFIGIGVMGAPMAGHLVEQGHTVLAYNRTFEKMLPLQQTYGFQPQRTIKDAVQNADIVFTIVGYPSDVKQVYLDPGQGIFENAKEGAILVDLTTSEPALAVELAEMAKSRGYRMIDAPVSGGDAGAKAGTLVVMCGAEEQDFTNAVPYLEAFGTPYLIGPPGSGQHCKAANQIVVAGNTVAYTEALIYLRKVGLDPTKVFNVISGGAAGSWQIEKMAPRAIAGDFPPGFFVKHFIKDMKIACKEADARGLDLPALKTVLTLYEDMMAEGDGDLGTQALIKHYEEDNK